MECILLTDVSLSVVQKVGVGDGWFVINREIINIPIRYLSSLSVWVLRYKPRLHASTDDDNLWRFLHVAFRLVVPPLGAFVVFFLC